MRKSIYGREFSKKAMASNLEAILAAANEDEINSGRQWYKDCHKFASKLAVKYGHSLEKIAGIISSLSPETRLKNNLMDTISLLDNGSEAIVTTYDNNKIKALAILDNRLNAHKHYSSSINKTASFYFNILRPLENNRVTIDRHASRVLHGYYLTGNEAIFYNNTPLKYSINQEVYKSIASKYDLLPHSLQAITWLSYRRLFVGKRYQDNSNHFEEIIL